MLYITVQYSRLRLGPSLSSPPPSWYFEERGLKMLAHSTCESGEEKKCVLPVTGVFMELGLGRSLELEIRRIDTNHD